MAEPLGPRVSRRLRITLVVSLALNLLVVGLVLGFAVSGRMPGGPPRGFDLSLGPLTEALLPEDRRAIGDRLRHDRPELGSMRQDRVAALSDLVAALRADPFDRASVIGLLDAQVARMAGLQRLAQVAFLDRVEAMSATERAAYADRIEMRLRGRDGGRDDGRDQGARD